MVSWTALYFTGFFLTLISFSPLLLLFTTSNLFLHSFSYAWISVTLYHQIRVRFSKFWYAKNFIKSLHEGLQKQFSDLKTTLEIAQDNIESIINQINNLKRNFAPLDRDKLYALISSYYLKRTINKIKFDYENTDDSYKVSLFDRFCWLIFNPTYLYTNSKIMYFLKSISCALLGVQLTNESLKRNLTSILVLLTVASLLLFANANAMSLPLLQMVIQHQPHYFAFSSLAIFLLEDLNILMRGLRFLNQMFKYLMHVIQKITDFIVFFVLTVIQIPRNIYKYLVSKILTGLKFLNSNAGTIVSYTEYTIFTALNLLFYFVNPATSSLLSVGVFIGHSARMHRDEVRSKGQSNSSNILDNVFKDYLNIILGQKNQFQFILSLFIKLLLDYCLNHYMNISIKPVSANVFNTIYKSVSPYVSCKLSQKVTSSLSFDPD